MVTNYKIRNYTYFIRPVIHNQSTILPSWPVIAEGRGKETQND